MRSLVRNGKVLHIGLKRAAPGLSGVRTPYTGHIVQRGYSCFARDPEAELIPTCRELGSAFVPYSPLWPGVLSGRFQSTDDLAENDFRRLSPRFQGDNLKANMRIVAKLEEIAAEE